MRHSRHSSLCIVHSALCIAFALAAASASAAPGWTSVQLTAANPYKTYQNALLGRQPYIFTNNNVAVAVSDAKTLTDGTIKIGNGSEKAIYNNSSLFYKLSDNPAGIGLKNVRITSSFSNTTRAQIKVAQLFVKTVAGGDDWIELANSAVSTGTNAKNWQSTYADTDGVPLAEGATDLWIYFGTSQQNSWVGYTEIEAEIAFPGDVYLPLSVNSSPFGTTAVSPASPNGDGTYLLNTSVTLTATPANGLYFYAWSGDIPAANARDNPLVMAMDDIKSITPVFTPGPFTAAGWVCTNITACNEYPEYANALRGRQPYIFTNNNASAAVSGASSITDGTIVLASSSTKTIYNNSSLFYKLSDDPAGVNLKNVRVTSSWGDNGRSQITIAKLFVKTVSGGDAWIELPSSAVTGPSGQKNYQATYADSGGAFLAEGATDLWIYFGPAQQNKFVGYTEIEAEMELENVSLPLVIQDPRYGTVAVSPASPNGNGTYPLDSVVTLAVTPARGYTFHSWTGDVPAGHGFDNPLSLTMDDTKTVCPIFKGPWHYASNVMTDGYWKVTTSLSDGKRTITKVESVVSSPVLDFRKETIGTDAPIVTINDGVLSGKGWPVKDLLFPDTLTTIGDSCRQMNSLTNLVLSANLVSLGHCAFWGCGALRFVSPLLPETVTSMGGGEQFVSAPLSGKLTLSNKALTALGASAFSGAWGLKEADLSKSSISSIQENAFRSSGVTNVYLPSTVTSLGHCPFWGCSSLRSIYFESCPATYDSEALSNVPETMRIVIFKDDIDWFDFLGNNAPSFTPWEDLSASVKSTYAFTDNCKPYGKVKLCSKGTVVFVATRSRPNTPTVLFLR